MTLAGNNIYASNIVLEVNTVNAASKDINMAGIPDPPVRAYSVHRKFSRSAG